MSEQKGDLFGKIDALLDRRAPDALLDKSLEFEDFPLLTEVVDAAVADDAEQHERRRGDRRVLDRRLGDRRQAGRRDGDRQATPPPPLPTDMSAEMERLVIAMEQRLTDMFIRQQLRMEESVRKAIRDEIDRHRDEDG